MPVARTPPHATRAPRAAPGQARRAADRAQRPSHRRRCTNIAPNPRASTAPPTQLAPQNMVCLTRRPARAPTRVAPSPGPLLASPPGMNTVVAVVAPRRAGGPRGQDLRPGMPFLAFQHHRGPHTNCSGCCVCMVSNCPQPQDHADRLRTDPHSHTPADPKAGAQGRPGKINIIFSLFSFPAILSHYLFFFPWGLVAAIVSSCLDHFTVKSRTLGWTCAGRRHDDDITPENFSPEKISVKTEKEMKTSATSAFY